MTTSTTSNPFGSVTVPETYQSDIIMSAERWNISPAVLAAQLNQESSFNPNATSNAGAQGIAQLMPDTAKGLGVDPWNPHQAIDAMAQLDSTYLKQFGSLDKALAAYNAGPGAVEKYNGIPPFQETQDYVTKILGAVGDAALGPAGAVLDPIPNVTKLAKAVADPNLWRRVGKGSLGVLVIMLAVYFMWGKEAGKVAVKTVNMV